MTVRIHQIPRMVCGKLPLWDHPERDLHVEASGLRYYKEPNVPEGFAESSPCGSIRPWNCPVTPNTSSTDLASHNDERASPIPSEQLVREETMTNCCQTWVPGGSLNGASWLNGSYKLRAIKSVKLSANVASRRLKCVTVAHFYTIRPEP